ncbi:hypothetical protein [Pseudescherichia vulneris]|uniref:hypothetical protein n=1 Tax=Pseudescherichia vulneris TaxID=566 RepID=UPI003019F40C
MKNIIAAAAILLTAGAHAAQPTEGHVDTMSVACGDHFVMMKSIDMQISGAIVDNQDALFTNLEHKARNGRTISNLYIIMTFDRKLHTGTGYDIEVNTINGRTTLTPVNYFFDTKTELLTRKPAGKPVNCSV